MSSVYRVTYLAGRTWRVSEEKAHPSASPAGRATLGSGSMRRRGQPQETLTVFPDRAAS